MSRVTPSARTHMGAPLIGRDRSWIGVLAAWRLCDLVVQDLPPRRQGRQETNLGGGTMRKLWIVAAGINGLAAVAAGGAAQHPLGGDGPRAFAGTAISHW